MREWGGTRRSEECKLYARRKSANSLKSQSLSRSRPEGRALSTILAVQRSQRPRAHKLKSVVRVRDPTRDAPCSEQWPRTFGGVEVDIDGGVTKRVEDLDA